MIDQRVRFLLLLVTCNYLTVCPAQSDEHEAFIDKLMQDYGSTTTRVPGASVLVICQGKAAVRRSYGWANVEELHPVTAETNFRLASLTKQFTAAATILLSEQSRGGLGLDDRIRSRWFPKLPEATEQVTVRHLLTHTSGLIDYEELTSSSSDFDEQLSDQDVLLLVSRQNRTYFTPGIRYRYSNSGYALLALIIEQMSGKSFASFLRERIFLPLQMLNSVAFENGVSDVAHRAFGYSNHNSSWVQTDQTQTSAVLGDGGIYSSIDDLAKWDAALYDNRLFSSQSLQLIFEPAIRTDDPGIQYGMGWRISGDMQWHSGETIGFRNVILRFPRQRLTVVILTNRNQPAPYQTALTIAHRFFCSAQCKSSCTLSFLADYQSFLVALSILVCVSSSDSVLNVE